MAEDSALIWQQDRTPRRSQPPQPVPSPAPTYEPPIPGGRVSLREAQHQFGVPASTLASWARADRLDAVKIDGSWMVTPGSVAAQLSNRHGGKTGSGRSTSRKGNPGPTADGTTMLVPRDAWDKLLDQLGNLHEAGQMLAEARERAARAETEVVFLRERLAEIRGERDEMKSQAGRSAASGGNGPGLWRRVSDALHGRRPPD